MGMENRLILDSQLSASSSKYLKSGAGNARLNMVTSEDAFGGWIAADDDLDPWLQIDFIVEASINAIRVQRVDLHAHGVYSFNVSYGNNESSIMMCKENGLARVSAGEIGGGGGAGQMITVGHYYFGDIIPLRPISI
jgi:hypothetical protein